MKRRAGILRRLPVAGLFVTLGLYAMSSWCSPWVGSARSQWWVVLRNGTVGASAEMCWPRGGVAAGVPARTAKFRWWFDGSGFARSSGVLAYASVPLWAPAAFFTAVIAVRSVRARRRLGAGSCPRCGYARSGLAADAACPECGGAC